MRSPPSNNGRAAKDRLPLAPTTAAQCSGGVVFSTDAYRRFENTAKLNSVARLAIQSLVRQIQRQRRWCLISPIQLKTAVPIRVNVHLSVMRRGLCRPERKHAAAKRHRHMGEIPTHPHALLMPLPCGPVVAGVVITELNVVMNVLAYGLRPRPTTMYLTEHGPGVVRQLCVSEYRLPSKYMSASSGRTSIRHCSASGTTGSGSPVSAMMNSL